MRYLLLILINLPVIVLSLGSALTQYKMKQTTRLHFIHRVCVWSGLAAILVASFPVYNLLTGKPIFESEAFSLFDILQSTAIVYLFYVINYQRQRIENSEKDLRNLHQELSIMRSETQ